MAGTRVIYLPPETYQKRFKNIGGCTKTREIRAGTSIRKSAGKKFKKDFCFTDKQNQSW